MSLTTPLADLLPPPTHVNDTHKEYSIAVACILLGVISSVFVLARLVTRWRSNTLGADDFAVVPATALYIGWTALAGYINLHAGVGKPLWEITVEEFSLWYKGIVITMFVYPIMSAAIRISIIFFYMRIFATGNDRRIKYTLWVLLGLQAAYVIAFVTLPAFLCTSLPFFWDVYHHGEYCNDWFYFYSQIGLYSVSVVFDSVLLFLPIFPVFKLSLPLGKRVGVYIIFALGAGASIAAAYKLAIFDLEMKRYRPSNPKWLEYQMSRFVPGQFDRYGVTFWIPSQVEPTVALVGTSLPALRTIFKSTSQQLSKLFRSQFSFKSSSDTWRSRADSHVKSQPPSGRFMVMNDNDSEIELYEPTGELKKDQVKEDHVNSAKP